MQESRVQSLGMEDPLEKKWKPIPVFLPGKSHDRGAWQATVHGELESDMPERLNHHMIHQTQR